MAQKSVSLFSLFPWRGQNRVFGDFFPISGWRPEIGRLPGTQNQEEKHNLKFGISGWSLFAKSIRAFSVVGLAVNSN